MNVGFIVCLSWRFVFMSVVCWYWGRILVLCFRVSCIVGVSYWLLVFNWVWVMVIVNVIWWVVLILSDVVCVLMRLCVFVMIVVLILWLWVLF